MTKRKKDDVTPIESGELIPVEEIEPTAESIEPAADEHAPGAPLETEMLNETPPTRSPLLKVKYIGRNSAILGKTLIVSGETRGNVSTAELERAEKAHPGEFVVVD
jgi:hypothetical protein